MCIRDRTYGEKLYKIALDGGMTCPNRDGTLGVRGCIFCSAGGSGDFAGDRRTSITEQIEAGKAQSIRKHSGSSYIAYFQAYTNTYAPVSYLRSVFTEAINHPDIRILSIATRPDCLNDDVLALLAELNKKKPVWVELGLQTIHEETAQFIRRGYKLPVFEDALRKLRKIGITVIVHTILCLPGESREMMLDTIRYLNTQDIQGITLQLLHILKHTDLADYYEKHPFHLPSREEYYAVSYTHLDVYKRQSIFFPVNILIFSAFIGDKLLIDHRISSLNICKSFLDVYKRQPEN